MLIWLMLFIDAIIIDSGNKCLFGNSRQKLYSENKKKFFAKSFYYHTIYALLTDPTTRLLFPYIKRNDMKQTPQTAKRVIGFTYSLFDQQGSMIESSKDHGPLYFLEASQQIIPGLENELVKMNVGDKKKISVAAKDAYGETRTDLIVNVAMNQLPQGKAITVGDQFRVDADHNSPVFIVKAINGEQVTLDGNHPMAGKNLVFDVEISLIRDASSEEIVHGHAHGADPSKGHH